jgi:hypothetical protein
MDINQLMIIIAAITALIGGLIGWAAFQGNAKKAVAILEDATCIFGDLQTNAEFIKTIIGPVVQGQPPALPTQEQWNKIVETELEMYGDVLDIEKQLQATIGIDKCNKLMGK